MLNLLKKIFTREAGPDYAALLKKGAVIIDVRSYAEFRAGHISRSINIPIDTLKRNLHVLPADKQRPLIVCCASGVRSSQARTFLMGCGYKQVFNGGGWTALQQRIK